MTHSTMSVGYGKARHKAEENLACQTAGAVLKSEQGYVNWPFLSGRVFSQEALPVPMHIYRADLRDLSACLNLDASYETDHVWQVIQQEDHGEVVTRFRTVRLPRTMRVAYPSWGDALLDHQERGNLLLVAAEAMDVRGYIEQEPQPDQGIAWIRHLIVAPAFRRQGIATALLARSMQDARQQGLMHVMTIVQSKNHPAISFLQHSGFTFCGYNERYFRNQDIALYFVYGL